MVLEILKNMAPVESRGWDFPSEGAVGISLPVSVCPEMRSSHGVTRVCFRLVAAPLHPAAPPGTAGVSVLRPSGWLWPSCICASVGVSLPCDSPGESPIASPTHGMALL